MQLQFAVQPFDFCLSLSLARLFMKWWLSALLISQARDGEAIGVITAEEMEAIRDQKTRNGKMKKKIYAELLTFGARLWITYGF